MCGFVIASSQEPDELADTNNLIDHLTHRGPDEQGTWAHGSLNVQFSQCRLSIIDPLKGHQPMSRGKSRIVYNGELYNFKELREKLTPKYNFKTDSDTEVFLQGYREWGTDVFDRARGMFSLAIWDGPEQKMVLARDPVGQKPLVYYSKDNKFMAASELQGLMASDHVSSKADPASLSWYLSLGYVPAPRTGFFNVKNLPPGHYMTVKDNQIQKQVRYWDPVSLSRQSSISSKNLSERIRDRLETAVERRLISDVPLGAFLSGGIDSTIVVGLMSTLMDRPVTTVSVGFERQQYDERDYARTAANAFNTDHHEYTVRTDLEDLLPKLVRHYGEPYADSSAVPTYYLSRQTRDHVKVALSGDGGDEAFGGYRRYRAMRYLGYLSGWIPRFVRKGLQVVSSGLASSQRRSGWGEFLRIMNVIGEPPTTQYASMVGLGHDSQKASLAKGPLKKPAERGGEQWLNRWFRRFDHVQDPAQRAMFVDMMSYLPGDLLVKTDIATMMNSLECRSP
ncbi:MAG: asparagine synthase (glutamine-hydrolyzing), partial [bacterium]